LVIVDRVDEPHLIVGSVERMRAFVWSMLDNKFLKQPGLGLKLLLPRELVDYMQREDRDFYQRARLDKQNMIPSLEWTGQALYDLANARVRSCAVNGKQPTLRSLLDDAITNERLIDSFRSLRVPRHLFKFLYRLLVAHCNAYTDEKPEWEISKETFEATLAVYSRDQVRLVDAIDDDQYAIAAERLQHALQLGQELETVVRSLRFWKWLPIDVALGKPHQEPPQRGCVRLVYPHVASDAPGHHLPFPKSQEKRQPADHHNGIWPRCNQPVPALRVNRGRHDSRRYEDADQSIPPRSERMVFQLPA
jgi:hypothetical protein